MRFKQFILEDSTNSKKIARRRAAEAASQYYHLHDIIMTNLSDGGVMVRVRKNPKDVQVVGIGGRWSPFWRDLVRDLIQDLSMWELNCFDANRQETPIIKYWYFSHDSFIVRTNDVLSNMFDGDGDNDEIVLQLQAANQKKIRETIQKLAKDILEHVNTDIDKHNQIYRNRDPDDHDIPF